MKKTLLIFLLVFLLFPSFVFARIGVGVGTGKIQVQDKLKPGMIYNLPPLSVLNTGDVASDYIVLITYHQDQKQIKPKQDWFIFSPKKFYLNPGQGQAVDIKLNLPINAVPGDYFAYLEAQPVLKTARGGTTIGIAAASKLYFTVVPANFLSGIYYKTVSIWKIYYPLPQIVLGIVILLLIILFFRKYFTLQVNLKK